MVSAACAGPRQLTPDVSWFQRDPPPPSCITDRMQEVYGSCGSTLSKAAAPARCTPRAPRADVSSCALRAQQIRSLRSAEDPEWLNELNALLTEYDGHPTDECGAVGAELLLELAEESLMWAQDKGDVDLAEQLYRRIIATFSQAELDRFGVCTSVDELRHKRAELLMLNERWAECASAFDEALAGSSSSQQEARDAALGSVVCHHRAWAAWRSKLERGPLMGRIEEQLEDSARWRGLLGSYHRFLCVSDGRADRGIAGDVALSRAETFYQGGALWEAAVGFRLLAYDGVGSREGMLAARRYAEVMVHLAANDSCRFQLTRDLERLHLLHCSRDRAGCDELAQAAVRAGGVVKRHQ